MLLSFSLQFSCSRHAGCLYRRKVAPFGENSLTLVDSVHQYLPFFSELRDKLLHERSLLYTWNVALGSNFVSLAAYYLMSPFNLLLLLFGKEQIAAVTCFLMCLKIALTAVAMVHFLSYKDGEKKRNFLIVAISVAYAFSNYVIGYNWNTMWLDCIMIFPLIMLGSSGCLRREIQSCMCCPCSMRSIVIIILDISFACFLCCGSLSMSIRQ